MKFIATLSLTTLFAVSTATAHHGQDFLLLEDYHLPTPGSGHFTTNFEWENGDADEYGLTPALMFGVLPRLALSLEADFRNEATTQWDYSSITPAAHFQISPPSSTFPVKFGISAGYQFGNADSTTTSDHHAEVAEHEHADEHGEEGEHHEEETDHHAEEPAHSHSGSVHAHGEDAFVGRFIMEADFGKTKAIFNLLSVVTDDEAAWGYATGVRHKITEQVALGVEALGDFESEGWHEIDVGTYFEPIHNVTLKLGAGFGLTEATPDFILRTGLIYRF